MSFTSGVLCFYADNLDFFRVIMAHWAGQKQGEAGFTWRGKLRWAVLSLVALLLLMVAAPAGAVEEGVETASATPCEGLKPFKDMDELVYQIYTNLDSDCLFKMKPRVLANIWGLALDVMHIHAELRKILLAESIPAPGDAHSELEMQVTLEPADDPIDILNFRIRLKSGKDHADYPFFPNSRNPKSLPEPLICGYTLQHLVWPNSDETRVMYLSTVVGEAREFHSVTVLNRKFPMDLVNCHYQSEK